MNKICRLSIVQTHNKTLICLNYGVATFNNKEEGGDVLFLCFHVHVVCPYLWLLKDLPSLY